MNQNKKGDYRFSRYSENQRVYLISIRQEKTIPPHGKLFHFKHPRFDTEITESWWHLLPGAYFMFEYNKKAKHHEIHKLIIQKKKGKIHEKHELIERIPDWLYTLIAGLPEFDEDHFNEKHSVYPTPRPEGA